MHPSSSLGLLALITTVSMQLAAASSQAVIHIEVDGVDSMDSMSPVDSAPVENLGETEYMDYFTDSAPAQLNKTQADEVCAKDPAYGPNYQACMGGPNGAPSGCVCKPSACLQPCFGIPYVSPKDGSRGCCPLGQSFSYDAKSFEGSCCSRGTTYSYDPVSRSGGCCAGKPGESKFTGKCAATFTPCTRPFPGSVKVGGKSFINYSNRGTWGTNIWGGNSAKTFDACEKVCSANTKCVAFDFVKSSKACYPKSDKNDKVPPVANTNVDSAIVPACLKKEDKCHALDGTIKVYDGVAYTFRCKYVLGYGNAVPTYTTPDLLTCIRDCSKNPKCQGVNYPVGGGKGNCNLKSNWNYNLVGNAAYVAAIPLVKR